MAIIVSASVTNEDLAYMEQNKLSPTILLRERIRQHRDKALGLEDIHQEFDRASKKIESLYNFLSDRGEFNEFMVWKKAREIK